MACSSCENGFVPVGEAWVQNQAARLAPDLPAHIRASRIASMRDSVYPCRECEPVAFALWVHRSAAGHDENTCGECRERSTVAARPSKRRDRPARMAVEERPPHPVHGPVEDF